MFSKITLLGTVKDIKKDKQNVGHILLSTTRPFPDDQFEYHKDFVLIKVWDGYFATFEDYLFINQLLLIEGRLESEGDKDFNNYVFAERIEKLTHNSQNKI